MKICLASILFLVTLNCTCQDNGSWLQIYKGSVNRSENLFISPYSVRIALMAAGRGSRGETRKQFDSLVGTEMDSALGPELRIANSIWISKRIHAKEDFIAALKNEFHSEYFSFDPANIERVASDINNWVKEKTLGKITTMPPPDPRTLWIIINAIYFKDSWSTPFNKKRTKAHKFQAIDGTQQELSTMYSKGNYFYFENQDLQAVRLPYAGRLEMIVLLPRKKSGLPEMEAKIDNTLIERIRRSYDSHPVTVFLPKFKLTSEVDMGSALVNTPLNGLFSSTADYSGVADERVGIAGLFHKTFIEIDEKQTEAVAVTEVVMTGYGGESSQPEPKVFRADHPFMFVISDKITGTIVFAGRFVKKSN